MSKISIEAFSKFGEIESATVKKDRNGNSLKFGFVCFKNKKDGKKCFKNADKILINCQKCYVNFVIPKNQMNSSIANKKQRNEDEKNKKDKDDDDDEYDDEDDEFDDDDNDYDDNVLDEDEDEDDCLKIIIMIFYFVFCF